MASLLRRALSRRYNTAEAFDPSTLLDSPWLGFGSRPVDGREQPDGEYLAYADLVHRRNGPIFSLMSIRQLVFSEARFAFQRIRNGRPGDLFGNGDLAILEEPWTNGTTGDLLSRMIQDVDLAGNAFVVRRDDGTLKRLRPDWVTIITASKQDPDLYGDALDGEIVGYLYSPRAPGSGDGDVLLPDEVAHFAPTPDPLYAWRGMSWLTPVLREVQADTSATQHKLSFFRQGATPQFVVRFDPNVKPEMLDRFEAQFQEKFGGATNAYKALMLGGGADITPLTVDLKSLDFKAVQGAGESRLASAAGVPPVIVGFSEGLAGSSLNAGNYNAARRRFADATLRPLWRSAAGALASIIPVPADARLWVDDRDVAFLREDRMDSAQIEATKATAIRQLTDGGFEPNSVIDAIQAEDMSRLVHTGYLSVQMQPPAQGGDLNAGAQQDGVTPAPKPALPAAPTQEASNGGHASG